MFAKILRKNGGVLHASETSNTVRLLRLGIISIVFVKPKRSRSTLIIYGIFSERAPSYYVSSFYSFGRR